VLNYGSSLLILQCCAAFNGISIPQFIICLTFCPGILATFTHSVRVLRKKEKNSTVKILAYVTWHAYIDLRVNVLSGVMCIH
jgi:hypothetical protein